MANSVPAGMVQISRRREDLLAAGALLILLLVFYRDVVFEGRTFLMETAVQGTMPNDGPYNYTGVQPGFVANDRGAIGWQQEPLNRFVSNSLRRGDFPLWNPYTGLAGSPMLADGVIGQLEPIQFVFFFVPDRFWPLSIDLQLLVRFFIAGFGCYLFARRLKLGFLASLAAGAYFMLCSYFVTFGDHPQIKAESLLPLVMYGYDRLADPRDRSATWIAALLIGWAIVAAMPESTFFVLVLGSLWYFFVVLLESGPGEAPGLARVGAAVARYLGVTFLGAGISAVYLLPFLEFVRLSHSVHLPGASGASWPLSGIPTLIFQSGDGRFLDLGFMGVFSLSYALLGLRRDAGDRRRQLFFVGYAIVGLLVMFDFPFTDWIRQLPGLNQIALYKYMVPSIVFCLAVLLGMMIDRTSREALPLRRLALALCPMVVLILLGLMPASLPRTLAEGLVNAVSGPFPIRLFAILLLGLCTVSLLHERRAFQVKTAPIGLLILVLIEPFWWAAQFRRPNRSDPYQSPGFVSFLKQDKTEFRVMGLDGILYPNISSAYDISDVRWLDPLVAQRAYDFSTRFIRPDEPFPMRFTGSALPLSDSMFDFLNVKYVLQATPDQGLPATCQALTSDQYARARPDFGVQTLDDAIFQQNQKYKYPGVTYLAIDGSTRQSIFAQPPSRLWLDLSVPSNPASLDFSIGLNPAVFGPDRGDGVGFSVYVLQGTSRSQVFSQYIDPKNLPCDRRWFDESIDLSPWSGQSISLLFRTDGGPAGDISWDWAYWGDVHLASTVVDEPALNQAQPLAAGYTLAYSDPQVTVYRNDGALPRAFVTYHVVSVPGFEAALDATGGSNLDLRQTAVVEQLPKDLVDLINRNDPAPPSIAGTARLVSSGELDVNVNTTEPGLLVVSDQYYPGWQAWVDGKPTTIYAVDAAFQGVFLESGSHEVQFKYRPFSFIIGGAISAVSVLVLAFVLQKHLRHR